MFILSGQHIPPCICIFNSNGASAILLDFRVLKIHLLYMLKISNWLCSRSVHKLTFPLGHASGACEKSITLRTTHLSFCRTSCSGAAYCVFRFKKNLFSPCMYVVKHMKCLIKFSMRRKGFSVLAREDKSTSLISHAYHWHFVKAECRYLPFFVRVYLYGYIFMNFIQ